MKTKRNTLCYRLFNNPENLEEALDKARRNGKRAEIKIWTAHTEAEDAHYGRIKSGRFTALYFRPCLDQMIGPSPKYISRVHGSKA